MTTVKLDATVTNTTGIESITISDGHTAPTSTATIECADTGLGIGDNIQIHIGWVGHTPIVFKGYVKNIEAKAAPGTVTITAANKMIRALDFFIAASNPDNPLSYDHISAEDLVENLMGVAGLNAFDGENSNFTFGIHTTVEVNLTSAYDYSKFIADIIAFSLWCDNDGIVHFRYRPPFPNGETADYILDNSNILNVDYSISDKDLRNRVVVYGSDGIHAEAKEDSIYLPDGFYKSVAVAAPGVIDTQDMAQQAAYYNLALLDRLTKNGQITIIGNPNISCRDVVTVNKADIGMTGDWYVYSIEHNFSKGGYTTQLDLRQ